jgi:hypothetical protein
MAKERTESELLFDQYLTERGYVFESQPKFLPGKTMKLDNRVSFEGSDVYFEVKEFKEGNAIPNGSFDPYKRPYVKLKDSWRQLNDYREYSCSLILYNGSAALVPLTPETVLGAMLGALTYATDKKSKLTYKFFDEPDGFRAGCMIDFKNNKPRSTQFSAVIVLEKFPLGKVMFSQLYDERERHREKKPCVIENAVDAFNYIRSLESNGFDLSETVLRVIVYENPYADIRLPRGLFQGPYDERWGSEKLVKITKLFEGSRLRELDAAIQCYSKSPLFEAGILKDK